MTEIKLLTRPISARELKRREPGTHVRMVKKSNGWQVTGTVVSAGKKKMFRSSGGRMYEITDDVGWELIKLVPVGTS